MNPPYRLCLHLPTPSIDRMRLASLARAATVALWLVVTADLQAQPPEAGLQTSVVPAFGYDSDLGFGYGAVAGLYRYDGVEEHTLYQWSVEPSFYRTTRGKTTLTSLIDVPYLADGRARLTAFLGYEIDCCQPYFGLGNGTTYDKALFDPDDGPNFYSYRRRRWSAVADVEWRLGSTVRLITGMAAHHNASRSRDPSTLFAQHLDAALVPATDLSLASIGPKVGIVFDTRDHERDPHRGLWIDALVWQGAPFLGSEHAFTRLTGTVRVYLPVAPRFTVAARLLGEHVAGTMSVAMLSDIASSFQDFFGLGGAKSVRGVLRTRYLGDTRALANLELRWRSAPFGALGQRWRVGAVAFVDVGRVWDGTASAIDGDGLHSGRGGGLRLTWGDAFVVASDVAHGSEAGIQTYIGLGHLF